LVNTGLKDFKITLGHVDFINGILEENAFDAETLTQIQALIIKKDFISIKNFTNNKLLCNLQFCVGDISVIDDTIANITNSKSKKSLMLLRGIYDKLKSLGYGGYISYDLSMIGNFEYYTGIIFSAYAYGIGFSIIDGGRYDNLLSYFGLDLPAVGFAVKINDLSDALKYQNVSFETASAVTLAAYDDEAWLDAIKVADELRAQGLVIENSLIGPGLKENLAYATSKNIEGVLYFEQGGTVKIIDLIENSEKSANIADLLNGGGPI
jgi:ATP phosphoribosyltransferase regulatory subunit